MERVKRVWSGKAALTLGTWVLYSVAFMFLYRLVGTTTTAAVMLPVIVTGWFYGTWPGLLAGLGGFLLDVLLLTLAGEAGWAVMIRSMPGSGLLVLVGIVVGRLRDLGERATRELTERKEAEEALRESEKRQYRKTCYVN